MTITKIDDVYLYANDFQGPSDCFDAKTWLDENNITYQFMYYGNPDEYQRLFDSASENWSQQTPLSAFPFLIYTEIHDDLSPSRYPQVCLRSLDEIKNSNLELLYKLGRS